MELVGRCSVEFETGILSDHDGAFPGLGGDMLVGGVVGSAVASAAVLGRLLLEAEEVSLLDTDKDSGILLISLGVCLILSPLDEAVEALMASFAI